MERYMNIHKLASEPALPRVLIVTPAVYPRIG